MNKMVIDTVIFDFDGTLLYTLEDLKTSVNFALAKYNMPLRTLDEVRRFVGNGVERLMELSIPGGKENPSFAECFSDFKEHYLIHCNDTTKPYDGVMDMLKILKEKGYKTAIVSNKYMDATKELSKKYYNDFIQVAIGEIEGIRKKPAPDTVLEAIKELKSDKARCIYVGDSEVDVKTARNCDIPCISCLWGFRGKDELIQNGADIFANKPLDVVTYLDENTTIN